MLVEIQDEKSAEVSLQKDKVFSPWNFLQQDLREKNPEIKEKLTNVPEQLGE